MRVFVGLVIALLVLTVVVTSNPVKNFAGSSLGYGTCPNCGDSWFWTESGDIWLGELKEGNDFSIMGDSSHTSIIVNEGLMICKKCLSNPDKLDADRIGDDLLKSEWEPEKVVRAKRAINAFKKGLNVHPAVGVMRSPI